MRTGCPRSASACLTAEIVRSPKWKTLAASTASAPASTAGGKCSSRPAPPLAISGHGHGRAHRARASRGRSPSCVPSASIELSRISPAPSAARLGGPGHRVDAGAAAAAVGGDLVAGGGRHRRGAAAGVDREHEHLGAEPVGDLGDQLGAGDGGGVHADLVGAGAQQPVDVVDGANAAADGERDEDLLGGARDHVVGRGPVSAAGGDVEEDELVGALGVVAAGQLDRVAGVAQVGEVDALDHAAGVDVEAGDDADGDGHAPQGRRPYGGAHEPGGRPHRVQPLHPPHDVQEGRHGDADAGVGRRRRRAGLRHHAGERRQAQADPQQRPGARRAERLARDAQRRGGGGPGRGARRVGRPRGCR